MGLNKELNTGGKLDSLLDKFSSLKLMMSDEVMFSHQNKMLKQQTDLITDELAGIDGVEIVSKAQNGLFCLAKTYGHQVIFQRQLEPESRLLINAIQFDQRPINFDLLSHQQPLSQEQKYINHQILATNQDAKTTQDLVNGARNVIQLVHLRRFLDELLVRFGDNYNERTFSDHSGLLDCIDPVYLHRPRQGNFTEVAFEIFYGGIGIRKGEVRNGSTGISCRIMIVDGEIRLDHTLFGLSQQNQVQFQLNLEDLKIDRMLKQIVERVDQSYLEAIKT